MHIPQLLFGGFAYTNSSSFGAEFAQFVHDRSLFWQAWAWIANHGDPVIGWLKQPRKSISL